MIFFPPIIFIWIQEWILVLFPSESFRVHPTQYLRNSTGFSNIYRKWLWSLINIHWKHLGIELQLLVTAISFRCHPSREQGQLQWDLVFMGIHISHQCEVQTWSQENNVPLTSGPQDVGRVSSLQPGSRRWSAVNTQYFEHGWFGFKPWQSHCARFHPYQSKSKAKLTAEPSSGRLLFVIGWGFSLL